MIQYAFSDGGNRGSSVPRRKPRWLSFAVAVAITTLLSPQIAATQIVRRCVQPCDKFAYRLSLSYPGPTINITLDSSGRGTSPVLRVAFVYPACSGCDPVLTPDPGVTQWISSNPSVATVSGCTGNTCQIQGINPGTATLTVKASNSLWDISGQQIRTVVVRRIGDPDTPPDQCTDLGRVDRTVRGRLCSQFQCGRHERDTSICPRCLASWANVVSHSSCGLCT